MFDSIFEVLFLVGFVTGCVIRKAYAKRRRRGNVVERRMSVVDLLLVTLSSVGLIVLPFVYLLTDALDFADYHLPDWAGWIGVVAFAAALWLLWRSHVDLGRNWSPLLEVQQRHTLVTEGVYRRIRHPMYAAHALWGIAQALLLQNWIAGPSLLAFFAPLYLLRTPREEQMMLDHFGEEYRQYMSRTGRIVPRLGK